MSVFNELQEVKQLLPIEELHSEVIYYEEIGVGHFVEELCNLALHTCQLHPFKQFVHIEVGDLVASGMKADLFTFVIYGHKCRCVFDFYFTTA